MFFGLSDTSEKARLHIVEFGSYWNQCEKSGEKPSDKNILVNYYSLTLTLTIGMTSTTMGLDVSKAISQKNGLVKPMTSEYETKQLRVVVETDGTGEVFDWMNDWIKTTRLENEYHLDKGISLEQL